MWREAARYEPRMDGGRARAPARPLGRGGRARARLGRAPRPARNPALGTGVGARAGTGSRHATMAELKPQRYKDDRPAELFMPVHEWSRTHEPGWIYELGPA